MSRCGGNNPDKLKKRSGGMYSRLLACTFSSRDNLLSTIPLPDY